MAGPGADTVLLGNDRIEVWPEATRILNWVEPTVKVVHFDDAALYQPGLIRRIHELATDPALAQGFPGYAGSTKVYHLDRWGCPEADLLHRRAIALFQKVVRTKHAAVDLSWANLYRRGDYCLPHSHVRALAGLVYFLDLGSPVPNTARVGRFCFADPRLKICCQEEAGAMTTPCGPEVRNGTMIMFPGKYVHMVDVYDQPGTRITISWNMNEHPIPGSPLP